MVSIIKQAKNIAISGTKNVANDIGRGVVDVSYGDNGPSISANFNQLLRGNKLRSAERVPLKELYQKPINATLSFPRDLPEDYYVIFNAVERTRKNRNSRGTAKVLQSIVLPIPYNLGVGYSVDYSESSLGIVGASAAGFITSQDINQGVSSLADKATKGIDDIKRAFAGVDTDLAVNLKTLAAFGSAAAIVGNVTALGGVLAGAGGASEAIKGFGVRSGLALNPHMAQVFQGVGFRRHEFTYNFIARSNEESETLRRIITAFKYFMYPNFLDGSSNLAFEYPEEFTIDFSSYLQKHLHKIGTSVLTSLDVNYNGQGVPLFFENTGAPVNITMKLVFAELEVLTKQHKDVADYDGTGQLSNLDV